MAGGNGAKTVRAGVDPRRVATLALMLGVLAPPAAGQSATCNFRGTPAALTERPSQLDSVAIGLGGAEAKLCYGRPSTRGRLIVGGQDPYGAPWRLGANEPTTLHLPVAATIGDVPVEPGSYSLYAIPDEHQWTIVVNGSTTRWGIPIDADVRASDVGSFAVTVSRLNEHQETLDFGFAPRGPDGGDIVYRWERVTFTIPIVRR